MKIFRLLAAVLLALLVAPFAPAQESDELAALRVKANKGNGIAQYNLGLAYAEGRGVAQDRVEAYVWLSLARENGARGRALDTLVGSFDKATFEIAQQRLADRKGVTVAKIVTPAKPKPVAAPASPVASTAATPGTKAATSPEAKVAATVAAAPDPSAQQITDLNNDKRQLSGEVATAWKEIETLKAALAAAQSRSTADTAERQKERDALAAKIKTLDTEAATLRTDHDRLEALAATAGKQARDAMESGRAASESARASEARVGELVRNLETATAELGRTKQALAALEQAPKPAPDTSAVEQKSRELAAAKAELESTAKFSRELEASLERTNTEKAALAKQLAATAAELDSTAKFGRELEASLSHTNDDKAALARQLVAAQAAVAQLTATSTDAGSARQQVAALTKARDDAQALSTSLQEKLTASESRAAALTASLAHQPAAPSYPDLSGQVRELEAKLTVTEKRLAEKPVAPAYPDLSGKVAELDAQVKNLQANLAAKPTYPDLSGRVRELEVSLAATGAKAAAAEQAAAKLTAQAGTLEQQNSQLVKTREQDKSAAQQAATQLAALAQARDAALAQAATLAAERDAARKAQVELNGTVSRLEQEKTKLAAAQSSSAESAAQITALGEKVAAAEKQAAAARTERDVAAAKQAELTASLAAVQSDRERQQKLLADTGRQLREATVGASHAKELEVQSAGLQGSVAKLEQEKTRLTAELAAARQPDGRLEQAQAHATKLEQDIQAEAKRRAVAEAGLAQLSEKQNGLANETAAAVAQVAALTKAKAAAEQDAAAARKAQNELNSAVTRLEQEKTKLAAAQSSSAESAAQITTLGEKLAAAEQQAAAARAERDAVSAKLTDLAANQATLQADRDQLQRTLADTTSKLREAGAGSLRQKQLETQVASLENTLSLSQAAIGGVTAERDNAVKTQGELRETIARQEKQLTDAAKPVTPAYPNLSGKVSELETQVASLQSALSAKPAAPAYPDLSARVSELETKLAVAEKQAAEKPAAPAYADLSGRVRELETAEAALKQQLAAGTTAVEVATKAKGEENAQLRRERDELSGRVTDLAGEIAQLRADRERTQKLLADAGRQARDASAASTRIKQLETESAALGRARDEALAQASAAAEARDTALRTQNELQDKLTKVAQQAPAYPDLSGKVSELETQVVSLRSALAVKPTAPSYPDLSARVQELEARLAIAEKPVAEKATTPGYPNLTGRVAELEAALSGTKRELADAQSALRSAEAAKPAATAASGTPDASDLQKQLAATEDRLATALRGYALLEKERDAADAKTSKAAEAVAAERDALATKVTQLSTDLEAAKASAQGQTSATQAEITRLSDALGALQRSSAKNTSDLAAVRALLQQVQGANTVLANENYQLKGTLARYTGTPAPVTPAPAAVPAARTHTVASGDSLSRLSQQYYGSASRWPDIYNANREKLGTDGVLRVGTVLRIP